MAGYEGLEVYRRAFDLACEIHHLSQGFPKSEQYSLADQMRRSSRGICANIAEGHAKSHFSKPEFKRFLSIAAGSSEETGVWIKFSRRFGYIDESAAERLIDQYDQISKMLNGLIKSL